MATLHPILAAALPGSYRSLRRSLFPIDPVDAEDTPTTRRRQFSSRRKPLLHPSTGHFFRRIRLSKLQKAIQYPETRPGFVQ
jgi:hypothetical protein